jgi:hypothetical protein
MPVRSLVYANAKVKQGDEVLHEKVRFVIGDGGTVARLFTRGAPRQLPIGSWPILSVEKNRAAVTLTIEQEGEPVTWVVTKNGCGCHG